MARRNAGAKSVRKSKKAAKSAGTYRPLASRDKKGRIKRTNPSAAIRGWVKARAVKIVRNKRGQAVSVKIRT